MIRTWYAIDPEKGNPVKVCIVGHAMASAVIARHSEQKLLEATSEDTFNSNAALTGNDFGPSYRQGAKDALDVVRKAFDLEPEMWS